jgi:hypothetical protein
MIRTAVTLYNHVGWFYDYGVCHSYYVGLTNKVTIFSYYLHIHAKGRFTPRGRANFP